MCLDHRFFVTRPVRLDERGADDICHGCLRTRDEIGGWLQMSDAERERMMDVVLPAREAARA